MITEALVYVLVLQQEVKDNGHICHVDVAMTVFTGKEQAHRLQKAIKHTAQFLIVTERNEQLTKLAPLGLLVDLVDVHRHAVFIQ